MLCPWIRGITAGCCGFWGSELSQGVQGRDLNQQSSVISPLNKVHWKKHFLDFMGLWQRWSLRSRPSRVRPFPGISAAPHPSAPPKPAFPSTTRRFLPSPRPRWIRCSSPDGFPALRLSHGRGWSHDSPWQGQALGEGGTGELQIPGLGSNP